MKESFKLSTKFVLKVMDVIISHYDDAIDENKEPNEMLSFVGLLYLLFKREIIRRKDFELNEEESKITDYFDVQFDEMNEHIKTFKELELFDKEITYSKEVE